MMSTRIGLTALLSAIFVLGLVNSPIVHSAILTVTDFGDTVPGGAAGQLRKLINDASPSDTIVIPAGTITLTGAARENLNASGDLDITKNLTIQGAGASATIIDGNNIDRVFHILPGASVAISGLTIRGGLAPIEFLTRGGGIFNEDGTLSVTDCIISDNTSPGTGGGIKSTGTTTVTNSTISGNSSGFSGGGIDMTGTMTISNSTISGNSSGTDGGGASNIGGTLLEITNSTISGNLAARHGAGLSGNGLTKLNNVTVTNNTADNDNDGTGDGGGIAAFGGFILKNTLLAGNTDRGGQAPDCSLASISSNGHNLVGNVTGCGFPAFAGNLDLVGTGVSPINPTLGLLQDNGGPTQTHALLPGSPAINAGTNDGCPPTDQRGITRPQGGTCDIGAFEFGVNVAGVLLNGSTFHTNQQVTYLATLIPGSTPTQVDIYLGVLLPDGVTFISFVPGPGGAIAFAFGPVPVPFAANVTLAQTVIPFSYMFAGTEPVGTYFTYAGLTVAGSDPLQAANQLSVAVQPFQFMP